MTDLVEFLPEDAGETIKDLELSNANCNITLNMFEDRFSDLQLLISTPCQNCYL